jgi:hypothetical protein
MMPSGQEGRGSLSLISGAGNRRQAIAEFERQIRLQDEKKGREWKSPALFSAQC